MYYELDTGIIMLVCIIVFHRFIMDYLSQKSPIMQVIKTILSLLAAIISTKAIATSGENEEICLVIASFLLVNLPPLLYLLIRIYIKKVNESIPYLIKLFIPANLIFGLAMVAVATNKMSVYQLNITESISAALYVVMMLLQVYKSRKKIPFKEVIVILGGVSIPFLSYVSLKAVGIDTLLVSYAMPVSIMIMLVYFGDRFVEIEVSTKTLRKKPFEVFMEENYKGTDEQYTIMVLIIKNMYNNKRTKEEIKTCNQMFTKAINEFLCKSEKLIYNGRSEYILFSKKTDKDKINEILNLIESKVRLINNRNEERYNIQYEVGYQVSGENSYNDVRRKAYIKAIDNMKKVGGAVE